MIRGKKYFNKDVVYVSFSKHYCPICSNKLKTVRVSKIVNYYSDEAKNFDFSFGSRKHRHFIINDDVNFIWKEFECPKCKKHYTVEELKKIEGIEIYENAIDEQSSKNRNKDFIIFFTVGIIIAVIIWIIKIKTG